MEFITKQPKPRHKHIGHDFMDSLKPQSSGVIVPSCCPYFTNNFSVVAFTEGGTHVVKLSVSPANATFLAFT